MMEIRLKLEKETKGALRYQEIDDKGEVIEQAWAKIGTLYMRKSAICARARLNVVRPSRRCYVLPSIPLEFQKLKVPAVSPPRQSLGLTSTLYASSNSVTSL